MVLLLLFLPFVLAVQALAFSFLWSGYRLANAEERQKILWIVLGALFALAWLGFADTEIQSLRMVGHRRNGTDVRAGASARTC